ncbi:MAG: sodium/potassium-transporting ATPase subunit alpha [Motiliproteus sp.]|jgi:sodium/potassium-transporting ATPase subunit alpha
MADNPTHSADQHQLSLDQLCQRLGCSLSGISEAEARQRLAEYGQNRLEANDRRPEILKFLRQFKNFFALLLIFGGALAFLAERLDPGQGNRYIAYALLAVVLLNGIFTYIQERKSEQILESFRHMLPSQVMVWRDGRKQQIDARLVVPGDLLLLSEGDRIPADGRIIEQTRLKIDLSSLTGESEPELRHTDCTSDNILESRNMVFSGTLVQSGTGRALVYATGMQTQIGSIVRLTRDTDEVASPIRKELQHFIRIISSIAISLGVLFFLVSVFIGNGALNSLIFAIGIIVANVPEGLLPTVTLALTLASKRMAKKNALIKNLESVETLGSTTVICTDKTGTLTQNRMSVHTVILNQQEFSDWGAAFRAQPGLDSLWETMILCNNASLSVEGFTGDPTEGCLLVFAEQLRPVQVLATANRVDEVPFDSTTKKMTTTYTQAQQNGYRVYLKGAPEVVLSGCSHIQLNGETQPLQESHRHYIIQAYRRLASRGERVLGLGWRNSETPEPDQNNFIFSGLVGMLDPPRPEVADALQRCRTAGIRVIMITGDYGLTAEAIGRQIGLLSEQGRVIRGDELALMSDTQLEDILKQPELIFARTSPAQKLRIVQALQRLGEVVTVTGDGVNDAPALKNADMGVAMGLMGTEVAKEASDMVLMDDNFATIVAAVEEGRALFENIKKFIAYILTSNVPQILPFIAFVLLDLPLPLTVVLILAIDLGTDILPALGLGIEAPETDVMKKPPRARSERLLSRNLLLMSYGVVGMIQAAAGFFSYFVVLYAGGWQWGESLASTEPLYRSAITAFFAAIIICQIADVLICRTRRQSLLSVGLFSNPLVLLGIAVELILLGMISYIPAFNIFFGTAPLQGWQLALSVPFAVLILLLDELRRYLVRRNNRFVLKWLSW